jgi:hypothetical protein
MSLREDLMFLIEAQKDYDRSETESNWRILANSSNRLLRDQGQALVEAVDENAKLWELVCWNIDNFRDLPLTDGYYAKWLERAEALLAARSKTVDGGGV